MLDGVFSLAYGSGYYWLSLAERTDVNQGNPLVFRSVPDTYSGRLGAAYLLPVLQGLVLSVGGRINGVTVKDVIGGGDLYWRRPGYEVYVEPGLTWTLGANMASVDGGKMVRLIDGVDAVISNPVWSPDGRFILYSEGRRGGTVRLRSISLEGQPSPIPEVEVQDFGDRYRFLPDGKSVVLTQGLFRRTNFWLLDLSTGRLRQLTDLKPEYDMKSFDVSPDGKQILFDRYRENSDVVLIDLPPR